MGKPRDRRVRGRRSVEDLSVLQILRRNPAAAQAFIDMRTQCVGCPIARFCTLRDVAAFYDLPLEDLLRRLQRQKETGR